MSSKRRPPDEQDRERKTTSPSETVSDPADARATETSQLTMLHREAEIIAKNLKESGTRR